MIHKPTFFYIFFFAPLYFFYKHDTFQTGTLRYCGPTEFANGIWAGIELDDPGGKNDGSIGGISYFQCPQNHGKYAIM